MNRYFLRLISCAAGLLLCFTGCKGHQEKQLKVAATSVPHAEILEFIQPAMEERGISLDIIVVDDYNIPNRALADKEVDANFFQHLPFLEAQIADFGYQLEPLVAVHIEPMGIYSKKISSIKNLKEGSSIAIPSDPSNEARALALLQQEGLISLNDKGTKTTLLDIKENPLRLRFIEMDAPLLSRSLEDVDAAVINANFALSAGLSPKKDALTLENGQSRYANIVVVRKGDAERGDLQALKEALTSEKTRKFIEEHYRGAITPAF